MTQTRVRDSAGAAAGVQASNEYLTFTLGKEECGIEVLKVQEIRGYEAVTRIANAPECITGVVNPAALSCRSWT
jgi:purine-binding chemotaxis protein CheW